MLVIGIAGGSGSGKTTVVKAITRQLQGRVVVIPQDSYYKDSSHVPVEERKNINFDHPDAIDWKLMCQQIRELKQGHTIQQPVYSYITCSRSTTETITVEPADVIIVEGILIFTDPELAKALDLKVFVDTSADERLIRIIQRDVNERGRGLDKSIRHYLTYVKPMHEIFIEPSKRLADIIIPVGGDNEKGIDILTSKIKQTLKLV